MHILRPLLLAGALACAAAAPLAHAQERVRAGAVQELTGRIAVASMEVYALRQAPPGARLFARAERIDGNFDPFIAVTRGPIDVEALRRRFQAAIERARAEGRNVLEEVPALAREAFVAWNDDYGADYSAAVQTRLAPGAAYHVIVLGSPRRTTFGRYRLLVGLDAPAVLEGKAAPTGARLAQLDPQASTGGRGVQVLEGGLTADRPVARWELAPLDPDDVLTVRLEAPGTGAAPVLELQDYGGKALAVVEPAGPAATLAHRFAQDAVRHALVVSANRRDGHQALGPYRLLLGLNAAGVAEGTAAPGGRPVVRAPPRVKVGIRLHQITSVDQRAENFGAVAVLRMEWQDDELAFDPSACRCPYRTFRDDEFADYAAEQSLRWPAFTIFNQQGNRWVQGRYVLVWPDGRALYHERFSATLQAPDFDFRRFPFDHQRFYIRVDSMYPSDTFVFEPLADFSGLGDQLGEEEWKVVAFDATVAETTASTRLPASRFSFGMTAERHLEYYIFRILLPLTLILVVSWITFFMGDLGKRVDVASANLLLFVAFNFVVASDLPRLGYLTLMDTFIVSGFVATSLVVVMNVLLKRAEVTGRASVVQRIDPYMLWLYPLLFAGLVALMVALFA